LDYAQSCTLPPIPSTAAAAVDDNDHRMGRYVQQCVKEVMDHRPLWRISIKLLSSIQQVVKQRAQQQWHDTVSSTNSWPQQQQYQQHQQQHQQQHHQPQQSLTLIEEDRGNISRKFIEKQKPGAINESRNNSNGTTSPSQNHAIETSLNVEPSLEIKNGTREGNEMGNDNNDTKMEEGLKIFTSEVGKNAQSTIRTIADLSSVKMNGAPSSKAKTNPMTFKKGFLTKKASEPRKMDPPATITTAAAAASNGNIISSKPSSKAVVQKKNTQTKIVHPSKLNATPGAMMAASARRGRGGRRPGRGISNANK
jgi:hypothetical protein